MKKIFCLLIFALAILVSQAWAQDKCYYGPGNCYNMPTDDMCENGTLVSDCDNPGFSQEYCDYGECVGGDGWDCASGGCYALASGATCNGVTPVTSCPAGHAPPAAGDSGGGGGSGGGSGGGGGTSEAECGSYCLWGTSCVGIAADPSGTYGTATADCAAAIANCDSFGTRYSTSTCTGTPIGGVDPNRQALGCCRWSGSTQCWTIWTGEDADGVEGSVNVGHCQGGSNTFWSGECPNSSGSCPTGTPVYDGTNSIRYVGYSSANLTVLVQASSLHISSLKDANVSLFDMSGKKVLSQKVSSGYQTVSLKGQKMGIYYAVVSSGSNKQTVKVILK